MAPVQATSLLSVEQYLASTFQPDMDYVDGVLEARSLGEFDHGDLQWALLEAINAYTPSLGIRARPEIRVQVAPTRFRVPDVCVVSASWKRTQIVVEAPLLCIEVLSPADRLAVAIERSRDYLAMGVPEVWVVDALQRCIHVVSQGGVHQHSSEAITVPMCNAQIRLADVFTVLDR